LFDNKNQILQENHGLVVSVARKWKKSGAEFMDLVQEGNLGLLEAMETFNPAYEVKLITYAMYRIKKRIREAAITHMQHVTKQEYIDFDTAPYTMTSTQNRTNVVHLGNKATQLEYVSTKEVLSLFSALNEKERKLLLFRLEGRTLQEVGTEFGTSRQRTEQIQKLAIKKLRRKLEVKKIMCGI
jgi:RNA polymerase sporulation-specific sigma factor